MLVMKPACLSLDLSPYGVQTDTKLISLCIFYDWQIWWLVQFLRKYESEKAKEDKANILYETEININIHFLGAVRWCGG